MNVTLIDSAIIAEGTKRFQFSKPDAFSFRAGQYIDLTLASGLKHAFSIASPPLHNGEINDELLIATRMRGSAFKKELDALEPGDGVQIDGPFGSFFLHENAARPAVFLAGGIGVTPFYSIVQDAAYRKLPHKIVMLFSNKRPEDAPFLENLTQLAAEYSNFTFVPTMDALATSKEVWLGEAGRIDQAMVKKYLPEGQPIFYTAGPPGMVTAMRTLLNSMGVSDDDIRFEEFSGY